MKKVVNFARLVSLFQKDRLFNCSLVSFPDANTLHLVSSNGTLPQCLIENVVKLASEYCFRYYILGFSVEDVRLVVYIPD